MPTPKLTDDELIRRVQCYLKNKRNKSATARDLKIDNVNVTRSLKEFEARGLYVEGYDDVEFPEIPEEELDAETLLAHHTKAFLKRRKHHQSLRWFPIKIKSNLPLALTVFGDPHLGSNGCNINLLRQHIRLVSETEGAYGMNIGDTVDNWGGRLVRLYAENSVSRADERVLARWFLQDSGVRWLVWLLGNHDTMDSGFANYITACNGKALPMVDWRAKFRLVFPNGQEARIDAAHNHKGHSMWNKLHGQIRAAFMDEQADIYVAGHHHDWGLFQTEVRPGQMVHLARARGYKWADNHADRHGFMEHEYGSAITFVIRPTAQNHVKFIRSFVDVEDAMDYLTIVREKAKKEGVK